MNNNDFKKNLAYEVLVFLCLMMLFLFCTRIWVLFLIAILGALIAALRLLHRDYPKIIVVKPLDTPPPAPTETNLYQQAYAIIQQRISKEVTLRFPEAKWQWLTPNAMMHIEREEPVFIILSNAGGYRKVAVIIRNLVFQGLVFENEGNPEPSTKECKPKDKKPQAEVMEIKETLEETPPETDEMKEPETVNYEYLAFEWVDAHVLTLNNRSNEAIAEGKSTFLIPTEELPDVESWPDICQQLIKNGFSDAVVEENGILVNLEQ